MIKRKIIILLSKAYNFKHFTKDTYYTSTINNGVIYNHHLIMSLHRTLKKYLHLLMTKKNSIPIQILKKQSFADMPFQYLLLRLHLAPCIKEHKRQNICPTQEKLFFSHSCSNKGSIKSHFIRLWDLIQKNRVFCHPFPDHNICLEATFPQIIFKSAA